MLRTPPLSAASPAAPGSHAAARHSPAHRLAGTLALAVGLVAGCGSRTPIDPLPILEAAGDAGVGQPVRPPSTPQSVVLFGGIGASPDGGYPTLGDTWVWTPTGGWSEAHPADAPSPRYGAMAASFGGNVVLFGGDSPVAETWVWDGTTWAQRHPGWSPPTISDSGFGLLGSSLALFGGYTSGTIYDDVWRWDGASWTHASPAVAPSAREAPAGAVLGGSLVIFGGEDDNLLPLGDTWAYDGASWTQKQPAHAPSPRRGAVAAAYDGGVVLFGGDTLPDPNGLWVSVDETWVWDGTDWTEMHPAQSPEPRSFAGMTAAGGVVLLCGGSNFGGGIGSPDGTWTWDGARWTRLAGPGPGPRNYPAMAAR